MGARRGAVPGIKRPFAVGHSLYLRSWWRRVNHSLLERQAAGRLLRGRKLREDTTVVEADIGYPTDAGICPRRAPDSPQALLARCRSEYRWQVRLSAGRHSRRRSTIRAARGDRVSSGCVETAGAPDVWCFGSASPQVASDMARPNST